MKRTAFHTEFPLLSFLTVFCEGVLGSAKRSDADLYQDKHTPRCQSYYFFFISVVFPRNGLIFFMDCGTINVLHKFNIHYAKTVFFLLRANYTFFSHIYIVNLIKMQIPLCRCVNSVLHKFV